MNLKRMIFFFSRASNFFSTTGGSLSWPVIYLYCSSGVQISNFGKVMGLEIAKLVS